MKDAMVEFPHLHILIAERSSFSERGLQALEALAPTTALDLTQAELSKAISDYEVLFVRLGLRVDSEVMRAASNLLVIATPTTGLDHIDLEAARQRKIAVLSLKGERAFLETIFSTAEHTFALLLALVRQLPRAIHAVKLYEWRRDIFRGRELNGKTLGVVGCGRLGSMVARYGIAFGMRVLAYDPYATHFPTAVQPCRTLQELLSQADIVSLHVDLRPETTALIDENALAHMKKGAILINTSRGAVIDEQALLKALESGHLAGAALDVLANEAAIQQGTPYPLIEYARTHDHLIITPHIGGASQEAIEKADLFLIEKTRRFLHNLNPKPKTKILEE